MCLIVICGKEIINHNPHLHINRTNVKNATKIPNGLGIQYLSIVYKVFNAAVKAISSDILWILDLAVGSASELEWAAAAEVATFTWSLTDSLTRSTIFRRCLCCVALLDARHVTAIDHQPYLLQRHAVTHGTSMTVYRG